MARYETGNEMDWQKIASSVGQIGGALQKAGMYKDYREDREKGALQNRATDQAMEMRDQGFSPEQTRQSFAGTSMQSPQLQEDLQYGSGVVNTPDQFGEEGQFQPATSQYDPNVAAFDMSGGAPKATYSPSVTGKAISISVAQEMEARDEENKAQMKKYLQEFSKKTPEEMQNLDPRKLPNSQAAQWAKSNYFIKESESEESKKKFRIIKDEKKKDMWEKFSAAVRTADTMMGTGTPQGLKNSAELLVEATNSMNNTPYRAEIAPDGKIHTYMLYEGKRSEGEDYNLEDYAKVLKQISEGVFYEAFDKNAKFAAELNKEKPKWLINSKGEMLQYQTMSDPLSNKHDVIVWQKGGGEYPVQNIQELYKMGFEQSASPQEMKAAAAKAAESDKAKKVISVDAKMKILKMTDDELLSTYYKKDPDTGVITTRALNKPAFEEYNRDRELLFRKNYKQITGEEAPGAIPQPGMAQQPIASQQLSENTLLDRLSAYLPKSSAPPQAVPTNIEMVPQAIPLNIESAIPDIQRGDIPSASRRPLSYSEITDMLKKEADAEKSALKKSDNENLQFLKQMGLHGNS